MFDASELAVKIKTNLISKENLSTKFIIPMNLLDIGVAEAECLAIDGCLDLMISMDREIWKEEIHPTIHSKVMFFPETWWDHVKRDLIPRWFVKMFLKDYVERCHTLQVEVSAKIMYPNFVPALPKEMHVMKIHSLVIGKDNDK